MGNRIRKYRIWMWIWLAGMVAGIMTGHTYGVVMAWVAGIMGVIFFLAAKAEKYAAEEAAKAVAEGRVREPIDWGKDVVQEEDDWVTNPAFTSFAGNVFHRDDE